MPIVKTSNILVENWLNVARDRNTQSEQFKTALENVAMLLFSEAVNHNAKNLIIRKSIKTPLKKMQARFINEHEIYIVPILRAGLGMLSGVKTLVPNAKIAHVGLYRNESTLEPHWYLDKLPKKVKKKSVFFVIEPMLATGGTITAVLRRIIILGIKKISVISALASKQAVSKLIKEFSVVNFYVGEVDSMLNSNGYIVPGLGDAGDRVFNI